jgi:heme/copper-type cytochrome/quinol oxidase subunit 4
VATDRRSEAATRAVVTRLDPGCGDLRLLRGGLIGGVAMALALTAHVAAGGRMPSTGLAVLLAAVTVIVADRLSRRRWTLSSLVALFAITQAVFHVAFLMRSSGDAGPTATAVPTDVMLTAHMVAALGLAMLVRYADALWWAIADLCGLRFLTHAEHVRLPLLAHRLVPARGFADDIVPVGRLLARRTPRRGPPGLVRELR